MKIDTISLVEAFLYHSSEITGSRIISSDHYDIQRALKVFGYQDEEFRRVLQFREPRSYSSEVDNALFFLGLSRMFEPQRNFREYVIRIERDDLNISLRWREG